MASFHKILLISVMGMVLTSCGGGGSGGGTILGAVVGGGEETPAAAFNAVITLSPGNLSPDVAGVATVTVTNSSGAVEDAVVEFTASIGALSPNEGIVNTNAEGIATADLVVPNASATGTLSASVSVDNVTLTTESITYVVTFNAPTLQLELLDGSGAATNDLTGFEQATVRVTLTDKDGAPVVGEIVQLTAGEGVVLGRDSGLTDANGQLQTTLTAQNISTAGTLEAQVTLDNTGVSSAVNYQVNAETTGVGSVNLQMTVEQVTIAPQTVSLARITVLRNDANSTPVVDAVVNFSANLIVLTPASGSVFTDENGVAEIELRAGTQPGATQLNAEVVIGEETFTATPINLIVAEALIELTLSDNVVEANEEIDVEILLVEATGARTPIAGTVIQISTTIGSFGTSSGLTDANGRLTLQMIGGVEPGEGRITATASVNGNNVSGFANFQNVGQQSSEDNGVVLTASGMVDAGGNPDQVLAGNETATITATVTEEGAPAEGVSVLFTVDVGRLSAGSATTNASGIATVRLTGAGIAGVATVEASANLSNGLLISGTVTIQTSSKQPSLRLVDAADNSIANLELSAAESTTVTVIVEDWNGSLVNNLGVTLTKPAAITSNISTGKTVAGELDVILTGTQTTGSGNFVASATFGTFNLSAQFAITSLGVNAATDSVVIGRSAINTALGANVALDGNEKVDVTVVVTQDNAVVEGITVLFESTGVGAGTLVASSDVTDATGTASVRLIGLGVAGTTTVSASATLGNGINVTDAVTLQTSAVTPTIDLVIRNTAGVILNTFGANQKLTLEATIVDFDGSDLDVDDRGPTVNFEIDEPQLGSFDPNNQVLTANDVAETNFCPVNGIKAGSDCAVVTMTSSSNNVVGLLIATVTINGIAIDDEENVTNTGINSGGPDQNSFTITRLTDAGLNHPTNAVVAIEGDVLNNETKPIRVDLADFFNNPVPDGTLVEFTTELGDITPFCTTTDGQCDVTFTSADPRTPDNTQVSFRNLDDDACPSQLVVDEIVVTALSGGAARGATDYRVADIIRVIQTGGDGDVDFDADVTLLTEGVNYTTTSDGIDCITCIAGTELAITYRRLWLDEQDDGLPAHVLLNPGQATEPFLNVTGIPCLAQVRTRVEQVSGTIDPTASVAVVGVGSRFKSQLAVGDRLRVSGEVREIVAIADDTNLTVDVAFSDNLNDISPERIAAPGYQGGMGQPYGARSTVLAYAVGEESFIDVNGNEEYDFGETFFDLPEAFLDKNEDGVLGDFDGNSATVTSVGPYNDAGIGQDPPPEARDKSAPFCYGPRTIVGLADGINDSVEQASYCYQDGGEEEIFIDFNGNGVMDVGNGIYNGSRCLTPLQDSDNDGMDDDIVCTTDLLNISRSVQILMANGFAKMIYRSGSGGSNGGGEIISSVVTQGGVSLGEQVTGGNFGDPDPWTAGASVTIAAGVARVIAPAVEDLLVQDDVFVSGRTHDVSIDLTTYTSGDVDVLAGGNVVIDDCATVSTCTATGVTDIGSLAIVTDSGFDGTIDNVSVIATTTGQTRTFAGVTVAANDNGADNGAGGSALLTEFEVGDTIDAVTVFPGVSEREVTALSTTNSVVTLHITDRYNGQLPNGTTVTVSSDNSAGCLLTSVHGKAVNVPNPAGPHAQDVTIGTDFTFDAQGNPTSTSYVIGLAAGTGSGPVTATVTTPDGSTSGRSFTCGL